MCELRNKYSMFASISSSNGHFILGYDEILQVFVMFAEPSKTCVPA